MFERVWCPAGEQTNAINAAADKECTRGIMAEFYADCIRSDADARRRGLKQRVDFGAVNQAILARWPRGLEHIKRLAHKLVEGSR